MNFLQALILGVIEGITEFLPISSTGHLMLAGELLKIPPSNFVKTFEIAIQLGAILAVVALYWRKLLTNAAVFRRVLTAFLPTAAVGLILYPFIKNVLLESTTIVAWALIVGGAVLVIFEWLHKNRRQNGSAAQEGLPSYPKEARFLNISTLPYYIPFCVGLFQSLAVVPGVSRAAATIIGGLMLGMGRTAIVEFSFLLAVPTMAAATGLDLFKTAGNFSTHDIAVLSVGFITSFIVALLAIKLLLQFIKSHTFAGFGWYRIVVGLAFLLV